MRSSALSSLALTVLVVFQNIAPLTAQAEGESDPLWNRPSYEKKITQIGQRIQAANGITERILYVYSREHTINATSDRRMGNQITVYEDLLTLVDSDDELASVLSHEIAHITLRHQRRGAMARVGVGLMMGTAIAAAAVAAPYTLGAASPVLARISAKAGTAPIGRSLEKEADLAGLDYLVKAGYNPLAMETLMNKIAADGNVSTRIFSDHPMGTDRLQYIHTAIVNRFPQYLTSETRSNRVPGSPYQVQTATTVPNRTVYANPNGVTTNTAATPTQHGSTGNATSSNLSGTTASLVAIPVTGQVKQSESPQNQPQNLAQKPPNNPPAAGILMLASAQLTSQPTNLTNTQATASVTAEGKSSANPVIEKTSAIIQRESSSSLSASPSAPATISYKTVKPTPKNQPTKVSYSHPGQTRAGLAGKSKTQASQNNQPGNQAQPASESVAQTLLELQPNALRLVKLVSQRGVMSHQDIVVEFESLDEDTLEAMLLDLQTNKRLLSMQGTEANSSYTLTTRAARVLRPQQQ